MTPMSLTSVVRVSSVLGERHRMDDIEHSASRGPNAQGLRDALSRFTGVRHNRVIDKEGVEFAVRKAIRTTQLDSH